MKKTIKRSQNLMKKIKERIRDFFSRLIQKIIYNNEIGEMIGDLVKTKDDPEATEKEREYAWFICYVFVQYVAYILGYIFGYYVLGGEKRYYKRLKKKYEGGTKNEN